jgi:hypothetical protein
MSSLESSSRLRRVVEVVEEAVEGILAEAEAEAHRVVAEAEARAERAAREKSSELTNAADEMLSHAVEVNERAQSLLDALGEAISEYESGESPAGSAVRSRDLGESQAPSESAREPHAEEAQKREEQQNPFKTAGESKAPRESSRGLVGASAPAAQELPPVSAVREQTQSKSHEREPLRTLRRRLNELGRPPRTHSRAASEASAEAEAKDATAPPATEERRPIPRRKDPSASGGASEGAVLLATQMAVAGGSREQIEARLRNDFGIEDPGEILDDLIY